MYVEDVDFCKRIANLGLRRIFLPKYRYLHFVGFTKDQNPVLIKGYDIYLSKHFKGLEKTVLLMALKTNRVIKKIKRTLKVD